MPLVSVIIPTKNRFHYLESCIASFMNQRMQDFEVIVIDDNSDESNYLALLKLAATNSKITVIQKPLDKLPGPASSRNMGLDAASGDWITFFDDDDLADPNFLSERIDLIPKYGDLGFLACNKFNFHSETELANWKNPSDVTYLFIQPSNLVEFIEGKIILNTASVLFKREISNFIRYNEELFWGDDWEFNLKLVACFSGIQLSSRLFFHRIHTGTITSSTTDNRPDKEKSLQRAVIASLKFLNEKQLLTAPLEAALIKFFMVHTNLSKADKQAFLNQISTPMLKVLVRLFLSDWVMPVKNKSFKKIKYKIYDKLVETIGV